MVSVSFSVSLKQNKTEKKTIRVALIYSMFCTIKLTINEQLEAPHDGHYPEGVDMVHEVVSEVGQPSFDGPRLLLIGLSRDTPSQQGDGRGIKVLPNPDLAWSVRFLRVISDK